MRIVMVVPSLSPDWGGPVTTLAGLTRALARQGATITVFATTGRRVGTEVIRLDGAETRLFQTEALARFWTGYSSGLARALGEAVRDCDLVHVQELWHYPHYAAYQAAWRWNKPYVVTVQGELDPWALRWKGLKKQLYLKAVQRRVLNRAAAIQALTTAETEQIRKVGVRAPIVVIPNGVDAVEVNREAARATLEERYPVLKGKRVVLFLGRLHPKKGLDVLVGAFGLLSRRRDDIGLLVCGPDEDGYGAEVERRAEVEGIGERTVLAGMVTGDQKYTMIGGADVFVLPSYSEGFSLAVLEALASGTPVVLSRQCYFPEVAASGAGLVVDNTVEELAEAVQLVIRDESMWQGMSERARTLVQRNYGWDVIGHQLGRLYEEVCGKARG